MCGESNHTVLGSGTDFQYGTTTKIFTWCICDFCDHHYINPIPTPQALEIIYPSTLGNYEKFEKKPGFAFTVKRWFDKNSFSKFVGKGNELRFLDIGCAAGVMLDLVRNFYPQYTILNGVDISDSAARLAVKKGFEVFIGQIEKIKLKQNYYDTIFMQQVIEHVHEPKMVLKQLFESLKPGGKLIMETPGLYTWDYHIFGNGYWEGLHIPRHFNLWTEKGMEKLLTQSGFSKVQINYKIKPVHWTLSIQNMLRKKRKIKWLDKRMDMNASFPLELIFFGLVDVFQMAVTGKGSDVQYVAIK